MDYGEELIIFIFTFLFMLLDVCLYPCIDACSLCIKMSENFYLPFKEIGASWLNNAIKIIKVIERVYIVSN